MLFDRNAVVSLAGDVRYKEIYGIKFMLLFVMFSLRHVEESFSIAVTALQLAQGKKRIHLPRAPFDYYNKADEELNCNRHHLPLPPV